MGKINSSYSKAPIYPNVSVPQHWVVQVLHQMAKLKYVVVIEQHSTFPNKMTSSII
jgi:hypothetical protein